MQTIEHVLGFWFGTGDFRKELWFEPSVATDRHIRDCFAATRAQARVGELNSWTATPRGRLALIIVLDQLSRNIYRDLPEAFAADPQAQRVCLEGLEHGHDRHLDVFERVFFYMPLMHAETLALQEQGITVFHDLAANAAPEHEAACQSTLRHAIAHRDVIARFGRFPHRNAVLGRPSTPEELGHLQHGRFG